MRGEPGREFACQSPRRGEVASRHAPANAVDGPQDSVVLGHVALARREAAVDHPGVFAAEMFPGVIGQCVDGLPKARNGCPFQSGDQADQLLVVEVHSIVTEQKAVVPGAGAVESF